MSVALYGIECFLVGSAGIRGFEGEWNVCETCAAEEMEVIHVDS